MLERYYIRPETIDRIRGSWIKEPIEQYVGWLAERGYAPRNVFHRVPILRQFGEFARARGRARGRRCPSTSTPLSPPGSTSGYGSAG